ncbi:MAG: hypothetical protein K2L32_04795 [Muribaculaceae bacterium]|nr:hypothetical protein [Muribaculaceae bacterium]
MSISVQYLIIGIVIGVCLILAVQTIVRSLRRGISPGCSSCSSTTCPLKKRKRPGR